MPWDSFLKPDFTLHVYEQVKSFEHFLLERAGISRGRHYRERSNHGRGVAARCCGRANTHAPWREGQRCAKLVPLLLWLVGLQRRSHVHFWPKATVRRFS